MGHADNKRERLEKIEQLLLSTRSGLTPSEIAVRLDYHRTSAQRDLTEIGMKHDLINEKGRYRLDPTRYISNVKLTPAEALSIYLALRRFIRQTSKAPEFLITAIQKVAVALRHPDLTEQLAQSSLLMEHERRAASDHAYIWETLLRGWLEKIVIRLTYQKDRSNEITTHEYEPYLFEPAVLSHGVYVIGWSRTRKDIRTFKIDRIHHASLTTERFDKPIDLSADDLLRNAWGVWYGQELHKVELLFAPEVANRVKETIWHPSQQLEERSDGSIYWTVEVAGLREVLSWVRGWGHEVEVLGPPEFRQQVADDMRAAAKLYEE